MSFLSPPSAPNPSTGINTGAAIAAQQQNWNKDTAQSNQLGSMVNQVNPFGSLSYAQTGTGPDGTPIYTSSLDLSPDQQNLFNTLMGSKSTAGTQGYNLLAGANFGAQQPKDVIGGMTGGITGDLMNKWMQSQQPFLTTQRTQLDTQLKNQGLYPGNPAYDNAMRSIDTSQTNAIAGAETNFEPQAFQQASAMYQLPASLGMSLAQFGANGDPSGDLVNAPQLNAQPANLSGAITGQQTANNQAYSAQLQQYQNMMSGLMGIPTAVLGGWAKGGFKLPSGVGSSAGAAGADEAGDAAELATAF